MMEKHLIYLLDTSQSIREGNKLSALNESMRKLCDMLREPPESPEVELKVHAFAFSDRGGTKVLNELFDAVPPEAVSTLWNDLPVSSIDGGTPLGPALIELAKSIETSRGEVSELGKSLAAPAIVILSDGEPTVTGEAGWRFQTDHELQTDLQKAKDISETFTRALRAVVALEVDKNSDAERLLFSLAHGSNSISTDSLCFHASDNTDSLADAMWSATLGTLSG
jgi:uncharacterized protein YegL